MNNIKNISLLGLMLTFILLACNKDPITPPLEVLEANEIISIDSVKNWYKSGNVDVNVASNISVFGTITADEVSGNLYKEIFIQDGTGGIKLRLTSSGSFYEGEYVRVSLRGAIITRYKNMLSIDNIDPDKQIIKQGTKQSIAPEVVTIEDITTNLEGGIYSRYQGKLIQLNDVEFLCSEMCKTWADAINQGSEDRLLEDVSGNPVIVRSSGFSSFANQILPTGKGSVIAVVTQFNTTVQLVVRSLQEVNLSGARFDACVIDCPLYIKDFEDQSITSGGWSTQNVVGNVNWYINDLGFTGTNYAAISNFNSGNTACETWLISKEFNLSGINSPTLSFQSAYNYSGAPLELYVTTSYTGDVTTTTWTNLTSLANWSTGGFSGQYSGLINISAYNTSGVRFAFKYTGTNTDGSTWEIDDFTIED
ncbi:DUF5689 domain-containing protein [Vicingus serpentipes]|nr:DUF5689 domain-containing protein [Vicingus serpentipes]